MEYNMEHLPLELQFRISHLTRDLERYDKTQTIDFIGMVRRQIRLKRSILETMTTGGDLSIADNLAQDLEDLSFLHSLEQMSEADVKAIAQATLVDNFSVDVEAKICLN